MIVFILIVFIAAGRLHAIKGQADYVHAALAK